MPKTVIITGASDGIGAAAARQLHRDGHQVVIVGRSAQKTERVARELGVPFHLADYTRLADVRRLAAELDAAYPLIDVLANNAGGVFGDPTRTEDGFEQTFQINHLAPFLLTQLLLDRLIASRASVIQTSSVGARMAGKLDLDNLDSEGLSPVRSYGTAKLENILFTQELQRRYGDQGISAVAFHPGNVATNFGASTSSRFMRFMTRSPLTRWVYISPDKGGSRLTWLAEGRPGVTWQPGEYYESNAVAKRVNPQTRDAALARALWERSEELLNQTAAPDVA